MQLSVNLATDRTLEYVDATNTPEISQNRLISYSHFATIWYGLECQFCIALISYRIECYLNAPRRLHNWFWIDGIHFALKIR